jgi:HK97 family phage prohead protease
MGAIVEYRNFGATLEARDVGSSERPRLTGYAAKFNTLSKPFGAMQFREKIDPRAFDETLASRADTRFTLNHNPNNILGRTVAGTLRLSTDRIGLRFDLDVPNTSVGRNLVVSVKRGDIKDCSFMFRTLDDAWSKDEGGNPIRTLKKVSLHDGDVAAVAYPAYPNTEINARAAGLEAIEMRGRECLGIRRVLTPAECDRELEQAFAELEVKAGPLTPLLYGYATVFHRTCANVKKGTRTVLIRGAFADSIARDLITANLIGHDKREFASTADGSLKLIEDDFGLRFEIRPGISRVDRDDFRCIFEKVQRGQVRQMSMEFGSRADDEHVDRAKGIKFVHKARLYHVSPVVAGAFPGTSIEAGCGTLESIAVAAAAARGRQLDLAQLEA